MTRAVRGVFGLPVAVAVVAFAATPAWAASNWVTRVASSSSGQAKTQSVPVAPTGVAAACVSSSGKQIRVTWSAVTRATSYTVFQSTTSATRGYVSVATGVTTTSWTSAILGSAKYWYEISAFIGTNWKSV